MKSFDYTRKPIEIEAYGKKYTLPIKTTKFNKQLVEVALSFKGVTDVVEIAEKLKNGIALFIGKEEADRIYPNVEDTVFDEMLAFWNFLKNAVDGKEKDIIENEYSPTAEIK